MGYGRDRGWRSRSSRRRKDRTYSRRKSGGRCTCGEPKRGRSGSASSDRRSSSRSSSDSSSRSKGSGPMSSSGTGGDPIVHFDWVKGMALGESGRYIVLRQLGEGTFGRVLECQHRYLRTPVAVKVIRDVDRYRENAKVECRILKKIQEIRRLSLDKRGSRGIVRFYEDFMHAHRFYCLSFERLGKTLYEVITMNNHRGFFMYDIQQIAKEFIETLAFLHDECGLIHTDIKMENIMLCGSEWFECRPPPRISSDRKYYRPVLVSDMCDGRHRSIRIIDFGNGVFRGDHHSTTINTRQYRAPEVILEQGWDQKSDMWSAGCAIAEMFTGELLFATHENMEHLAMIERITGQRFDGDFFSFSPPNLRNTYSSSDGLNWPVGCTSSESFRRVNDCLYLEDMFKPSEHRLLGELLTKLLRIDARCRYSASKALRNCKFFSTHIPCNT